LRKVNAGTIESLSFRLLSKSANIRIPSSINQKIRYDFQLQRSPFLLFSPLRLKPVNTFPLSVEVCLPLSYNLKLSDDGRRVPSDKIFYSYQIYFSCNKFRLSVGVRCPRSDNPNLSVGEHHPLSDNPKLSDDVRLTQSDIALLSDGGQGSPSDNIYSMRKI
jgi:hypothetical protein